MSEMTSDELRMLSSALDLYVIDCEKLKDLNCHDVRAQSHYTKSISAAQKLYLKISDKLKLAVDREGLDDDTNT